MRETITVNRILKCSFLDKEVAQQISAYTLISQENQDKNAREILTKYCSGEHSCKSSDCQFIIGIEGKVYSKEIQKIYYCIEK